MRLFVGIFPDNNLRNQLRDIKNSFVKDKRNLKFVPIDQMHMTIKFLGNGVGEDTYHAYVESLKIYLEGTKKFEYEIENLSFGFPYEILPTVLLANVKENENINLITKGATQVAKDIGMGDIVRKQEHKRLIHHFTVARSKPKINKAFVRMIRDKVQTEFDHFKGMKATASAISIVQSDLTPTGPVYKIMDTIELK